MEENKDQQKLYGLMQMTAYLIVAADVIINLYRTPEILGGAYSVFDRLATVVLFSRAMHTKLFTLLMVCLVGIGTVARKNLKLDPKNHIAYPLALGLLFLFASTIFLREGAGMQGREILPHTTLFGLLYIASSFAGAVLAMTAMDNISKLIKSNFGKDKWNIEGESFPQDTEKRDTPTSINIPMLFYHRARVNHGYININPFRGTLIIGTPGSGKSFGVINPAIRQFLAKGFTMCLYDFKFPDLAKIAYYHYLFARQQGRMKDYAFHVVNLNDITKSNRINPLHPGYVRTLAEAQEISSALVEALKKGDRSGGADQFFTQSAINFLAAVVYFFAKHEDGRYSTLPHVLSFLNKDYEKIFTVLFANPELESLLSPFESAFRKKSFDQLEGQIGTLKIFISRLATKESYWVFSKNDFNLKISDPKEPSVLVLANDPSTQDINSALYALVVNRLVRLINSKGNLPTCIIADEVPTLFIHKVENLIATARSNRVAVMLGLQELPQFRQQYGKETAESINAVIGNILSGSVRDKQTLDWLERLFGKIKQTGESLSIDRSKTSVSMSEKLDALIPAGKIASLKTAEMVGLIAKDAEGEYTGEYESSAVHCKINLDLKAIAEEEKNYPDMPVYYDFRGRTEEVLAGNFHRINREVADMVERFMDRPE